MVYLRYVNNRQVDKLCKQHQAKVGITWEFQNKHQLLHRIAVLHSSTILQHKQYERRICGIWVNLLWASLILCTKYSCCCYFPREITTVFTFSTNNTIWFWPAFQWRPSCTCRDGRSRCRTSGSRCRLYARGSSGRPESKRNTFFKFQF